MPTRDETSRLFDELEAQLEAAMNHVLFDAGQHAPPPLRAAPPELLATLFSAPVRSLRRFAVLAQPTLDRHYLDPIVERLDKILALHIEPEQRRFGNGLVWLTSGRGTLTVPEFACILIRACAILGTQRAVQLFRSWVEGEPMRHTHCLLLVGLSTNHPSISLTDAVAIRSLPTSEDGLAELIPAADSPDYSASEWLGQAVLSIDSELTPAFFRPGADDRKQRRFRWADRQYPEFSLPSLCEALSLACNAPIDYSYEWNNIGELVAFSTNGLGGGWSRKPTTFSRGDATVGPEQRARALEILRQRGRPSKRSSPLDLAIRRWWSSKSGQDLIHQLIDLRVALERLYAPQSGRELRFRVAICGAWHLGSTYEERKEHWDALRETYDLASTAVHTGDVKEESKTFEVLNRGQDLCRLGILKLLEEGNVPDWNDLILGKTATDD